MFKPFSVLLSFFALVAYSADESTSFQLKPMGRISKANGNAIEKPVDIVLSPAGSAFVLQSNKRTVAKYDMQGHLLSEFGKPGKGMSKPTAIVLNKAGVWVADAGTGQLHHFQYDAYIKSISLESVKFPQNLAVIKDLIFCSGHGIQREEGGILVLDKNGNKISMLSPEIDLDKGKDRLWGRVCFAPLQDDRLLVGYLYDNQAFVLDRQGEIVAGLDMSSYYDKYEMVEKGRVYPSGYAATSFCEGPGNSILVATCDNTKRTCGLLYQFDADLTRKLCQKQLDYHIWKMRFFREQGLLAVVKQGSEILFFKTGKGPESGNGGG